MPLLKCRQTIAAEVRRRTFPGLKIVRLTSAATASVKHADQPSPFHHDLVPGGDRFADGILPSGLSLCGINRITDMPARAVKGSGRNFFGPLQVSQSDRASHRFD